MATWHKREATRVWAAINPSGEILADSTFKDEAHAWSIALGWPGPEEIEQAKKDGWKVKQVSIIA